MVGSFAIRESEPLIAVLRVADISVQKYRENDAMRAFWIVLQVVAVAVVIFLVVAAWRGTIGMPLGLLLAVPAVLLFRVAWKRTRTTQGS
jgi:hypothetical protein